MKIVSEFKKNVLDCWKRLITFLWDILSNVQITIKAVKESKEN